MAQTEQPPPVFEEWLLAQVERDDPVGDAARALAGRPDALEEIPLLVEDADSWGRSLASDSFRTAIRDWEAERARWHTGEATRFLERLVFELLTRFHAESNACHDGRHCQECSALVMGAFGHTSWEQWVATAEALPRGE